VFYRGQAQLSATPKNGQPTVESVEPQTGDRKRRAYKGQCAHCHKPGHPMEKCWTLHPEQNPYSKPVALVHSRSPVMVCDGLSVPKNTKVDSYGNFKSAGFVSSTKGQGKCPITMLRDTGSAQTLLVETSSVDFGKPVAYINIQGVGCTTMLVPLHEVWLESEYWTGRVVVGKVSCLPVRGVDMILGNDGAGDKVNIAPRLVLQPCVDESTEKLQEKYPGIFPSCVTMGVKGGKGKISEISVMCEPGAEEDRAHNIFELSEMVIGKMLSSGQTENVECVPTCVTTRSQGETMKHPGPQYSNKPRFRVEVMRQGARKAKSMAQGLTRIRLWKALCYMIA